MEDDIDFVKANIESFCYIHAIRAQTKGEEMKALFQELMKRRFSRD